MEPPRGFSSELLPTPGALQRAFCFPYYPIEAEAVSKMIPPLDAAFLHLESHDTPMHVAALQIFSLPSEAPADYMQRLVEHLRSATDLAAPWNLKLDRSLLSRFAPRWVIDRDVDLDYHVRHLALPSPGGERELGVLVSRLHSHRLTHRRPLWECHVIEGLEHNRFAVFIKIHHSLTDGVGAMRLLMDALAGDPDSVAPAPWAVTTAGGNKLVPSMPSNLRGILPELTRAFTNLTRSIAKDELVAPLQAPASILNLRVTGQRRLATLQVGLARIKAIARQADVTVNDVVLAVCAAALRRYLKESNALPSRSLTAMIPVSLRGTGSTKAGNAVGAILARLGTDVADPRRRLQCIQQDTARAKAHLNALSPEAAALYSNLFLAPYVMQSVSGLAGRTRPYFNITVSNVPGPAEPRYLLGARLEALYPVSIPTHGQSLNITCASYAGTLNFGFTACREVVPHMQRLAVYTGEALEELEKVFALVKPMKDGDAITTPSHRSTARARKRG